MEFSDALIYFCGFIGCAAIPFVPLRSFESIAFALETSRKALIVVAILASLAAVLYEIHTLLRLYHCLTATSCPNAGIRMWLYLTMFGLVYLGFEFVFFVMRKINSSIIQNKRLK